MNTRLRANLRVMVSITWMTSSSICLAQQIISTSSTSTVTALGGDLTVNAGVIIDTSASRTTGINVNGIQVDNLINSGTIKTGSGGAAIYYNSTSTLGTILNNGSVSSKDGLQIHSPAAITNNGSMSATDRAITINSGGSGSSITINTGLTGNYAAIANRSANATVYNKAGATISGIFGIENVGTITNLTNYGTIRASRNNVADVAIGQGWQDNAVGFTKSTITNLYNFGTIYTANSSTTLQAVSSVVTNLVNSQSSSVLRLLYQPTSYSIVVSSLSNYGKLSIASVIGDLSAFSIYSSSVLTPGTYNSIISGISSANLTAARSGTFGGYNWSLVNSSGLLWDLVVASPTTDIVTASGNLKSALGSTVNRRFNGGTLTFNNTSTDSSDFTITSNNGTIDHNGLRARFAGVIANDHHATPGKLIIANSGGAKAGAVELTGTNTYSGGTEVQAGAVLSIAAASALGTGSLDLIGSATVPATLETTQTMTISNPITVSGDPVFNVAPNTTTTVSSPITDGASAGDVVVNGGGTLNLTAVNTYTGPTTVEAGSTLALSGSGSITPSNAVTNSGTFDLTSATNIVNLGGTFTQTGTGTTNLVGSPNIFQKIVIGGAASLSGTLGLTAASGSYRIGRYTLLNAGSISGTFSSFSNNLASVTSLGYALSYDASNVYLNLAPNSTATLQSIQQNGQALGAVINMQAAALQAGLSYDCVKYDENNLCISVGGRYTYAATGPSGNAQAGLVIVGYRPSLTTRFGAFADQSANISTPNNITETKTSPMWGVFGTWNMNKDGNGLSVQGSAAYAASELNVSRTSSAVTEAGQGKTQFNGQAYQLQANYAQPVSDATKLIPYLGLRYTRINQGAYTENSNAQVLYPVSYNAMAQNTFSAIAGVGVQSHLAEKLKGKVAVGLQQNLNYSMGNYAGVSSIPGMTSFSTAMPNSTNTMATANGGLYYDVRKNEQIGLTALWQQQPFINTNTTSVIASYTIGF